ncbi:MAG: DUF2232 domain-containing protein [Rhodospirillales bacterium]|nr:DUF2232 domain-containing protein [Rhodospirillales bacterium]
MQKNMIIAVGGGGLSAAASMAFLAGTPGALFFAYLATLPIFLVGFSMGPVAATVAGLGGFVMAGLLGGALAAGMYGLVHALPAWLVSRQSLLQTSTPDGKTVWYPVGSILGSLSLFCAGLMGATGLFIMGNTDSLHGLVSEYLSEAFSFIAPAMTSVELGNVIEMLVSIFPGAMGASWILMLVVNALVAQRGLVRMGRNLRPSPRLKDLVLPQWLAWPMIGMAVLGLLASGDIRYIAQNTAIVLAVPYFFLGLSVVHWAVRRVTFAGPLLVAFYLALFVSGWALLAVAAVGMAEQWAGLRSRFSTNQTE